LITEDLGEWGGERTLELEKPIIKRWVVTASRGFVVADFFVFNRGKEH